MMATRPTHTLPFSITQNPSPKDSTSGQEGISDKNQLTQDIMVAFRQVLPSNYVASTNGPWYSLQFQALAEQMAEIQIEAGETFKDSGWDFTRPDFLWETIGGLVFPNADERSEIPQINGDVTYRTFLSSMVNLLLSGSKKTSIEGGLEAVDPDIIATVTERYLESGFGIEDQFIIDIMVETAGGTAFPEDPIGYQANAALVIKALKPAHVLTNLSYLFRDAFGDMTESVSFDIDPYYYGDFRRSWLGPKEITGTGTILANRALLSDPTLSFASIRTGAVVAIDSGVNAGRYVVRSTETLISGLDATLRAYTTSSGLSGFVSALNTTDLEDTSQNWGLALIDETVEILTGPNAGTYRLDTVLGSTGGPVGSSGVSGTKVRLSPSILRLDRRTSAIGAVSYSVAVDRLGVQTPRIVQAEDASLQFYL